MLLLVSMAGIIEDKKLAWYGPRAWSTKRKIKVKIFKRNQNETDFLL